MDHVSRPTSSAFAELAKYDSITRAWARKEINKRVDQALAREEAIIEERREKLKHQMLSEQQIIENAKVVRKKDDAEILEEKKKRLHEIELNREMERKEQVEKKLQQLKMINSEELRTAMSKKQTIMIKNDQWWQVQNKLVKCGQQADQDEYYHKIIIEKIKEGIRQEEIEAKTALDKKLKQRRALSEQLDWKKAKNAEILREKEKEKIEIDLLIQKIEEEKQNEIREKKRKSEESGKEMKRYAEEEKLKRQQRKLDEKAMLEHLKYFQNVHEPRDKLQFKRELETFQACLNDLREKRKAQERRFDDALLELEKERERKRNAENCKMYHARQQLFEYVMTCREEQLKEKEIQNKLESDKFNEEKKKVQDDIDGYKLELQRQKREENDRKREYAENLRQQIQLRQEAKKKEFDDKMREREQFNADFEERRREVENLLSNPIEWKKHPLQGDALNTFYICTKKNN